MSDAETQILQVLQRYASGPTARGMMRKAKAEVDGYSNTPAEQLPQLRRALASGIRLFIDESFRDRVNADLIRLEGRRELPPPVTIHIKTERDARRARMLTRSMCADVGAAPLTALKAATGLSELTRNILNYAGEGSVFVGIDAGPPRIIRIEATDKGPGIPDLELVLSGRYKSRTGLGKGLLGTQRIASHFDIHTDRHGTRVEFEVTI